MLSVIFLKTKFAKNVAKHILQRRYIPHSDREIEIENRSTSAVAEWKRQAGSPLLSLSLSLWEEERRESRKPIRDEIFSLLEEQTRSTLLI